MQDNIYYLIYFTEQYAQGNSASILYFAIYYLPLFTIYYLTLFTILETDIKHCFISTSKIIIKLTNNLRN